MVWQIVKDIYNCLTQIKTTEFTYKNEYDIVMKEFNVDEEEIIIHPKFVNEDEEIMINIKFVNDIKLNQNPKEEYLENP